MEWRAMALPWRVLSAVILAAGEVLMLHPATGTLKSSSVWRRWFS